MSDKLHLLGNAGAVIFTALQIDYAGLQNVISIICLVLTCLSVALSIVSKCVSWYNKASKDGKITSDEIREIADDLHEEIESAKEDLKGRK